MSYPNIWANLLHTEPPLYTEVLLCANSTKSIIWFDRKVSCPAFNI